ncbi:hypothetical protein BST44_22760 [Mycobacterium scrofulaceum]|uniref:DUF3631 domain-containing protein n=1 Tax=Mycobacterium scrofulaceum TaxID=1783 RepID=A0A1X0K8R5_MYCSC|nr:hypothetical protein BST44_22760 [Mycobacterium scrofulaceum]
MTAVTLWVAATHLLDRFDFAPRLVIRSALKQSGKSRLLEVVAEMVHAPLKQFNATTPYIFRSLDEKPRTLLIDEADALFGTRTKADLNEDLRALLNAGFQRGATIGRTVGPMHEPHEFPVFAMAALAGIGRMPDTIEDRAIVVLMQRRKPDEKVEPYRLSRDRADLTEVRAKVQEWTATVPEDVGAMRPDIPVDDRPADLWEPLIIVAELAGGEWPERARLACKALTARHIEDDTASVQLLADIREMFTVALRHECFRPGEVGMFKSEDLCSALRGLPDSPWREIDLTPSKLGRRLSEFGVKTTKVTVAGRRTNYYRRSDFDDVFARYLPTGPDKAGLVGQTADDVHKPGKHLAGR